MPRRAPPPHEGDIIHPEFMIESPREAQLLERERIGTPPQKSTTIMISSGVPGEIWCSERGDLSPLFEEGEAKRASSPKERPLGKVLNSPPHAGAG